MRLSASLLSLILFQAIQVFAPIQQVPAKGFIDGVVKESGSDQPILGAEVRLLALGSPGSSSITASSSVRPVKTDSRGRFEFLNIDAGSYTISVSASGYSPQEYGSRQPGVIGQGLGKAVDLTVRKSASDLVVHLTRSGTASGRILADGNATPGLEVRLVQLAYDSSGRKNLRSVGSVLTNSRGEYRVSGLGPGTYFVVAVSPSLNTRNPRTGAGLAAAGRRFPETFYPGAIDLSKATPVEIQSGAELRGLDFEVSSRKAYTVRGRVLDKWSNQGPIERIAVAWHLRDSLYGSTESGNGNTVELTDTGAFEFNLLPGKYWFEVRTVPVSGGALLSPRPISLTTVAAEVVSAPIDNLTIRVDPTILLRGRITIDGKPPKARSGVDRIVISAASIHGPVDSRWTSQPLQVSPGDDGRFSFERFAAGDYQLKFQNLPPDVYVKSAMLGPLDVLNQEMRVLVTTTYSLDIVLAADGGRVDGIVADQGGYPIDNAQVVLIPEAQGNRLDLYRVTNTDERGRFSIRGAAPGAYRLLAWDVLDGNAYLDSKLVGRFLDNCMVVDVTESSTTDATLKVIHVSGL